MNRNLQRQLQDIWFCNSTEELSENGYDTIVTYSKPELHRMSVSATSGWVNAIAAGFVPAYDRYITSYERDFHPEEGTCVFVDVVPELDGEGNLALINGDTLHRPVTAPDYIIKRILDTQKGTVARYGIEKQERG